MELNTKAQSHSRIWSSSLPHVHDQVAATGMKCQITGSGTKINDVRAQARSSKPAQAGPGKPSRAAFKSLRVGVQFSKA